MVYGVYRDQGSALNTANIQEIAPNFKVAFIGDQGITLIVAGERTASAAAQVLELIRDEGADMVIHSGDFDYKDDPAAWKAQIDDILGESFPYFASIGNHDVAQWDNYQRNLLERVKRIDGADCIGDYGINSSCTYKGLFFILSGAGTAGDNHEKYIKNQLEKTESIWRVCSWHKNQQAMQIGGQIDRVGWEPYEECRKGGAIIATAHSHTYSRTKTLSNTQSQTVDPLWQEPDLLRVGSGSTFAFVSGAGGLKVRDQDRCLPSTAPYGCNGEWASIYTGEYGALFIEFNVDGDPRKAHGYFKNQFGELIDSFTVIADTVPPDR